MPDPAWLGRELAEWRQRGLERSLWDTSCPDGEGLNFADNDYLDLSRHADVIAGAGKALREHGAGARASRVMAGNLKCHRELEERLASLKGYPSALLFSSGYLANIGAITALAGRGDAVYIDRLAHASLIDGTRLSGARLLRFRHNDVDHLRKSLASQPHARRRLVITESVFSMDGDRAPLPDIALAAAENDATLLIDDAHAGGVFGDCGSGLAHSLDPLIRPAVIIGTLGKAFGSHGGFVVCSVQMRNHLIQKARAFTYTTALPPPATGAALAALDLCARKTSAGSELLRRASHFRRLLQKGGADTGTGDTQIVPVMLGVNEHALELAAALRRQRIFCLAVRPPTVPDGSARIRFSVTLRHGISELTHAAGATLEIMQSNGWLANPGH